MAYQSQFYTAGTVTVADGSAIVNGSETGWETALIEGGVFYVLGSAYPILSVEDETKLTLAIPFSGEGAAGLAYAIDRQRSAAVSSIAMNDRLAAIIASIHAAQPESDILSAFASLQGVDGKLAMFTSENTLALVDYIADAKGSLAKLAALALVADQLLITDAEGNMAASGISDAGKLLAAMAGSASEYLRADGTKANVSTLPVSSATQSALNGKYNVTGGVLNGQLTVLDHVMAAYSDLNNQHQYSQGIRAQLGSNIWMMMTVEHNPNVAYTGILQLGSPGGLRNWSFGTDSSFTSYGPIIGTVKNFELDHPVDPDNYDLRHASTESPEMLVEYRGTVQLANGRATVNVEQHYGVQPGTFDALWADAWVTALQNQDGFDRLKPTRVNDATFDIICENENSGDLVSWVVMARRNDPYVRWEGCKITDANGKLIIEFEKEAA